MNIYKNITSSYNFNYPHSCKDTINKECKFGESLETCIDNCAATEDCQYGFFIESDQNTNKSVCFDISTKYAEDPVLSVINSTDKDITFFYKSNLFPGNNEYRNEMYIFDTFHLQNVETSKLVLGKDNLQIWNTLDLVKGLGQIVQYGEKFAIRKHLTTLFLTLELDDLIFKVNTIDDLNDFNSFRLKSLTKKDGENIYYNDEFYIMLESYIVVLNGKNLEIEYKTIESLIETKENFMFRFIPDFDVFYCDNGKCVKTNVADINPNPDGLGTYVESGSNRIIYNDGNCSIQCDPSDKLYMKNLKGNGKNSSGGINVLIIIFLIIIIGVLFYIISNHIFQRIYILRSR
jgi:hypothetical protein